MKGGDYIFLSVIDVLVWMGKNCETCKVSSRCCYCGYMWDTSISHCLSTTTAENIGYIDPDSICKLKK